MLLKWHFDRLRHTREPRECIGEMIRQWHPTVAGLAFRRWNMPGDLDEPVMCHHDYLQAAGNRRLAAVVYLANRLSHRYGFGCAADGTEVTEDPATLELGLSKQWLAALDEKAPGLFSVARQIVA